jgi:transposase
MDILIERACGLDVHQKSITACILTPEGKEIKTFRSVTSSLLGMIDWIKEHRCSHVAMESTGVLWKPIVNLLESEDIDFMVVNAAHMKALPGRKTDVKDAEWIATLLQHGLLKASYIPDRTQRELREVVRYRRSLIQERVRELNRIQKILEGANIKLSSVISKIFGVSGRAMLEAMIHGEVNPEHLAELARGRMKSKKQDLTLALDGRMNPHQRLMLQSMIKHIDFLDEQITAFDEEVAQRLSPFQEALERIDTIPGIGQRTAEHILSEIGLDNLKARFPSAGHLCSWIGLVPGQNESAGKRKPSKTRKGNKYLRQALIEAAQSVARSDNYLGSQFRRISARRGGQRAAVAVAHSMMIITYNMLTKEESYRELGADYYDRRQEDAILKRTVNKLKELGYAVTVEKLATAN